MIWPNPWSVIWYLNVPLSDFYFKLIQCISGEHKSTNCILLTHLKILRIVCANTLLVNHLFYGTGTRWLLLKVTVLYLWILPTEILITIGVFLCALLCHNHCICTMQIINIVIVAVLQRKMKQFSVDLFHGSTTLARKHVWPKTYLR